ncbi:MAG TPA: hypothetical protein PKN21_13685, partial [Bacteroidales bacterium]|nr:hypothetical protein [Bacteroidales bacterium]
KTDLSGTTINKKMQLDAVIAEAVDMSNRLVAYATIEGLPTLLKDAKVNSSELYRMADTRVKGVIQALADLAEANIVAASAYGVTAEATAKLKTALASYNKAIPEPKMSIDENKQVTTQLGELFKKNEILFKKTDALIKLFKNSHTDFYNSYTNLRKVIATGKGNRALNIQVRDANTGKGLSNVQLVIEPADNGAKAASASGADLTKTVKMSSAKGGSTTKTLPDGKYTVTASRADYATQTASFSVVKGIMTNVVINMIEG